MQVQRREGAAKSKYLARVGTLLTLRHLIIATSRRRASTEDNNTEEKTFARSSATQSIAGINTGALVQSRKSQLEGTGLKCIPYPIPPYSYPPI